MKRAIGSLGLVAALLFSPPALADFPRGYQAYEPEEFQKALAHAARENKRVLIVLATPNCRYCAQAMWQMRSKELREVYEKNFIALYAIWPYAGAHTAIWHKYTNQRTPVPTFVFLMPEGKGICREVGGFWRVEEGVELGKKVLAMNAPPPSATNEKALPQCSKL